MILGMNEVLAAALSSNNAVRREAESRIGHATGQRGFAVALASKLSTNFVDNGSNGTTGMSACQQDSALRLMAGSILQRFVRDCWEQPLLAAILPPEDKEQVRALMVNTMIHTLAPREVRASAARVVALIAAAGDWRGQWVSLVPSLLGQLALAAAATAASGGSGERVGDEAAAGDAARTKAAAVDRAESCAKCLEYIGEEVSIVHVPELFRQSFLGLLRAGQAAGLPRGIRLKVFRITGGLFRSIGTLVTVGGETPLLLAIQQWVPPWLTLVSNTLKSAADGTSTPCNGESKHSDDRRGSRDSADVFQRDSGFDVEGGFGVELEALRTAMTLLTHMPSAVGDGHLGQLLPPLWELLTKGLAHHEAYVLLAGDDEEEDGGYASDGERQGFEQLIVQILELLAAVATCEAAQVSALLGGEGAGLDPLMDVVMRYLQLAARSVRQGEDDPNGFAAEEDDEGCQLGARAAGVALIQDLCDAFPAKAVPALIAAAKSAFANPGVDHQGLASSGAGGEPSERSREGGPLSQGDVPARSWRLREAALLGLGTGSKAMIVQVKRRCRAQAERTRSGPGGSGLAYCILSPEKLCAGASELGLDLPGFQAVIMAAVEGRHCGGYAGNVFVQSRGLWAAARLAPLLSAEAICRAAEACSAGMGDGHPLILRLHACRALGLLSRHGARLRRKGGSHGVTGEAARAMCDARIGAASRVTVGAAPSLAAACEEGTVHFVVETMTQLVKYFPEYAVAEGGTPILIQFAMNMWVRHSADPLVVEVVEDLLLSLLRVPQALPQMIETVVPCLPEVFERVRAGEARLEAVAQGSLSLLREVAKRAKSVGGIMESGTRGGSSTAGCNRLDPSIRDSLLFGLRGAGPLLLETDSHALMQEGCSTLAAFVVALSGGIPSPANLADSIPCCLSPMTSVPSCLYFDRRGVPPPPAASPPALNPSINSSTGAPIQAKNRAAVSRGEACSCVWRTDMVSSAVQVGTGSGSRAGSGNVDQNDVPSSVSAGAAGSSSPPSSALSLVLAFLGRVMAPGFHETALLFTGVLLSAVLTCVPPRCLGKKAVQDLLCASFDKLERSSSSLVNNELLLVFVTFVNHPAYGATALVDFLEDEDRRRQIRQQSTTNKSPEDERHGDERSNGLGNCSTPGIGVAGRLLSSSIGNGSGNGSGRGGGGRGIRVSVRAGRSTAVGGRVYVMAPASATTPKELQRGIATCSITGLSSNAASGIRSSSSSSSLSATLFRPPSGPGSSKSGGSPISSAVTAQRRAENAKGCKGSSLRILLGRWLFFHENVQSPNIANRSAVGLLRLLAAASQGDERLIGLEISTDCMKSDLGQGGIARRGRLPPFLRGMEGKLLPVCLLSSIVRTAKDHHNCGAGGDPARDKSRSAGDVPLGLCLDRNAGVRSHREQSLVYSEDGDMDSGSGASVPSGKGDESDDSSSGDPSDEDSQGVEGFDVSVDGDVAVLHRQLDVRAQQQQQQQQQQQRQDDDYLQRLSSASSRFENIPGRVGEGGDGNGKNLRVNSWINEQSNSYNGGDDRKFNGSAGTAFPHSSYTFQPGSYDGKRTIPGTFLPPACDSVVRSQSSDSLMWDNSRRQQSSLFPSSTFGGTTHSASEQDLRSTMVGGARGGNAKHQVPRFLMRAEYGDDVGGADGAFGRNAFGSNATQPRQKVVNSNNDNFTMQKSLLTTGQAGGRGAGRLYDLGQGMVTAGERWSKPPPGLLLNTERGVAAGLVRFLRAARGEEETRLRGWAGGMPQEEQAYLGNMLRAV